jgi:hypothetical protein
LVQGQNLKLLKDCIGNKAPDCSAVFVFHWINIVSKSAHFRPKCPGVICTGVFCTGLKCTAVICTGNISIAGFKTFSATSSTLASLASSATPEANTRGEQQRRTDRNFPCQTLKIRKVSIVVMES